MNKTLNNVIYNIAYQILNMVIPLITAPYISRVMGPSGVGVYSYSTSVASYFAIFMLLGIANYGSRTIAISTNKSEEELSKSFWEMYTFQLLTSVLVIIVYISYVVFGIAEYKTVFAAQTFYLISVLLDIGWYFTGTGQFKVTVTRGVIIKIVQTIFIFLFVNSANDIIRYILIITIGTLVGNLALWPIALKQIRITKITIKAVKQHIKPNLVLFLPLLASSVFVYMDKIMLQLITDATSNVGWYEYAEKIVRIPLTIVSAIGAVMMPKISTLIAGNDEKALSKYMHISMRYIALLSSAMCFGIVAIAPELAIVYLGEEFLPCGSLMQVLSCIIIFSSFANILRTQYLIPMKKDKSYAWSIILGAVVNLLLNAILIPHYGAMGAAVGTIGAEFTVWIGHVFSVRKELKLKVYLQEWLVFLACGFIMMGVVRVSGTVVKDINVRLIAEIVIGVMVYCILVLIVLIVKKDTFLKAILTRKGRD